jgi:type IV pilus assembly protein PilA
MGRTAVLTVLAVLHCVGGAVLLLATVGVVLGSFATSPPAVGGLLIACLLGVYGFGHLATGAGLLRMSHWARSAALTVAVPDLLVFPIGTLLSGLSLYYLTRPGAKVLFSEKEAYELDAQETNDLARLGEGSPAVIAVVVATVVVTAVLTVPFLIFLAVLIPGLLHSRIAANEAEAIGDIRSIISAEVVYQTATGRYGTLACLATPESCIPGYRGSPFVDPAIAAATKRGYRRKLVLGEDGRRYAISAAPITPDTTGSRRFCGDETGLICQKRVERSSHSDDDGTCDMRHCIPL